MKLFNRLIQFLKILRPPKEWHIPVLMALGVFVGIVGYILHISNATSYMSDDPKVCMNCHVMKTAYATWERSSHKRVAKCTDCHVPHDNILKKYLFKAKDGVRHAAIFTMHAEPEVIRIKHEGAAVVQENCIRCHLDLINDLSIHEITYKDSEAGKGPLCWDCHRETPHGKVRSLSAVPNAHVPQLPSSIPDWFNNTFIAPKQKDLGE